MESSSATCQLLKNVSIPMRDGVCLAARVFVPAGAGPFPVVVNLNPYHKDGVYSVGYVDATNRYLAARGYVAITADLRGTGASGGQAADAFGAPERLDGYDLVEWAARQSWSSGAVGMWGLSYGGITALSTASATPPSLRAIVAIHAATDLYWDYLASHGTRAAFSPDVHWGIRMAASNALPPLCAEPDAAGEALWRARLEGYRPWIVGWHEDAGQECAWRSRITSVDAIRVPAYIVGGWRDIFADVAVRTFAELGAPKRLLIGPWKHIFPDLAASHPVGFLPEKLRWWDRWLKDIRNGMEDEPPVTHFVYGANEWRHERTWPPPHGTGRRLVMSPDRVLRPDDGGSSPQGGVIPYAYTPLVGLDTLAMHWLPGPDTPQYPPSDDALSICFDTPPLAEAMDLVGTPTISLRAAATIPEPPLVGRLFEITAEGEQRLITLGWVKGRGGRSGRPENRFRPGVVEEAVLPLRPIAYRIRAGSRIRVTLSCADLSRIWPEPTPFSLEIHPSRLHLPGVPGPDPALPVPQFAPPAMAASPRVLTRDSRLHTRRDTLRPAAALEARTGQLYQLDDGVTISADLVGGLTVDGVRPWLSTLQAEASYAVSRPAGSVRAVARMREVAETLTVTVTVSADGLEVFAKTWTVAVRTPGADDGEPGS